MTDLALPFPYYPGFRNCFLEMPMTVMNKIALLITIIGALNWGSIGLFSFDIVAWISGGATTVLARIIYIIVALAGLWCISLLFHRDDEAVGSHA